MAAPKVVIVTGANRGIGRAICQLILSDQSITPVRLYATSRKGEDLDLPESNDSDVEYPKLDISSSDSITSFRDHVRQQDKKVDVLINNAGVNLDQQYSVENAKRTLDVNYRGTLEMCKAFLPLLSEQGRIVNLSSVGSSLGPYSKQVQEKFRNMSSLEELEDFMKEFEKSVQNKSESKDGFKGTNNSYSVSKACVNAFTAILARENSGKTINACCPGWVSTDMGGIMGKPPKKPEDGAKIPVRLGFADLEGVSGRYWANDSISGTGPGKVQVW